jgi:predicted  nucleic acid-binding Zn-ribbon protein
VQEVQSHARTNTTKLQHTKNGKEALELVVKKVKLKSKEEKECTNIMEQGLTVVYNRIPDNVQAEKKSAEEKLNLIAQTINKYRKEIEEIKEKLNPTTPLKVREQRKQEVSFQIGEMEKQVNTVE